MRDLKIYILIASVLFAGYMIAQYNRPVPTSWKVTLAKKDKIPYGTYVVYNRLHDLFPASEIITKRKPVFNVFKEDSVRQSNYIIIAGTARLDQYDVEALLNYIKKGNDVLIAAYDLNDVLNDTLQLNINTEAKFKGNNQAKLNFTNPQLDSAKKYSFDRNIGDEYFSNFDTSKAVVLGKNQNKHSNFIKYKFGKGSLYLISSPLFFTNYSVLKPAGAEYAAKVLSHLSPKKQLIWDEFSVSGPEKEGSVMRVFFAYPNLKRAYYITLCSLLVFVIFEIKRRQRIIPVIDPLKNTTLEFVNVVGQVYYQQRDNKNIALKKVTYFLEHIRSAYGLKTNVLDDEFSSALIHKSGADKLLVTNLLKQITHLQGCTSFSDSNLIGLNRNIEKFYKQSN